MALELTELPETLIPMDELLAYLGDDVDEGPNLTLTARAVTDLFRSYTGRPLNQMVGDYVLHDVIETKRIMTGLYPLHALEDNPDDLADYTYSLDDTPQIDSAVGGVSRSDGVCISGDVYWRIDSGYVQIPADITMAYVGAVRDKYTEFTEGNAQEGADIKSISIPDVGRIETYNPTQAWTNIQAYMTDPILYSYIGVLEPYRAGHRKGAG